MQKKEIINNIHISKYYLIILSIIFIIINFIFSINAFANSENISFNYLSNIDKLFYYFSFITITKVNFDFNYLKFNFSIYNSLVYNSKILYFEIQTIFNRNLLSYLFFNNIYLNNFTFNIYIEKVYYKIRLFEFNNVLIFDSFNIEFENGLKSNNLSFIENNHFFHNFYEGNLPLEIKRNYFLLRINTDLFSNNIYYINDNYIIENLIINFLIFKISSIFLFDKTSEKFYIPLLISFETSIKIPFIEIYFFINISDISNDKITYENIQTSKATPFGISFNINHEDFYFNLFKQKFYYNIAVFFTQNHYYLFKNNVLILFPYLNTSYFDLLGLSFYIKSKSIFLYSGFLLMKVLGTEPEYGINFGIGIKFKTFYFCIKQIVYDKNIEKLGLNLELSFNFNF
ncbi:MAG: hypothetical protein N3A58_02780 [Spirochaetes bacterium]|nr:hypothetical protein [Spirochaetota bacterium]